MKRIIYYELLETDQTVNDTRFSLPLERLNQEIKKTEKFKSDKFLLMIPILYYNG